jgi:hypothetical protein
METRTIYVELRDEGTDVWRPKTATSEAMAAIEVPISLRCSGRPRCRRTSIRPATGASVIEMPKAATCAPVT